MKTRALHPLAACSALVALAASCGRPPETATITRARTGSEACTSCHARIVDEWRASYHRLAFTDATFRASLALEEPREHAFCTRCHAPAAERAGVAEGVDCRSCHAAPHARSARAAADACTVCHEFAFDRGRTELVQKTVSEHAASSFASLPCTKCHAPPKDGHTDHRFTSGHAPEWLAGRVRVTAARVGQRGVAIGIDVDAGHAFPTGDMFRRVRLLVFAESADGRIVGDAERVFARTWGSLREGEHAGARTEVRDTRIHEHWSETFVFDAATPIVRARYSLVFERAVAVRGPHVSLASSDEIARGELAW